MDRPSTTQVTAIGAAARQRAGRRHQEPFTANGGGGGPDITDQAREDLVRNLAVLGDRCAVDQFGASQVVAVPVAAKLTDPFELKKIDCPLLLVWGDRDRMVFTTGAERVLRTVDYSDIEVIPNCGHCPQLEVPEQLAELLIEFPGNLEYSA